MPPTRLDGDGIIVTADYLDEGTQPWGGASCYRYIVRVSSHTAGEWSTIGYGSQHDYSNGDNDKSEEILYMVIEELLSAYWDEEEFFQLAIGEPDDVDIARVRGILELIDYAEKIGPELAQFEDKVRAYQDGELEGQAS